MVIKDIDVFFFILRYIGCVRNGYERYSFRREYLEIYKVEKKFYEFGIFLEKV